MKQMSIHYHDLNDDARKEFDRIFGPAETYNHEIVPLAIFEQEEDDDE